MKKKDYGNLAAFDRERFNFLWDNPDYRRAAIVYLRDIGCDKFIRTTISTILGGPFVWSPSSEDMIEICQKNAIEAYFPGDEDALEWSWFWVWKFRRSGKALDDYLIGSLCRYCEIFEEKKEYVSFVVINVRAPSLRKAREAPLAVEKVPLRLFWNPLWHITDFPRSDMRTGVSLAIEGWTPEYAEQLARQWGFRKYDEGSYDGTVSLLELAWLDSRSHKIRDDRADSSILGRTGELPSWRKGSMKT